MRSSLHKSWPDGTSELFRYLENYDRITLDDACRIGIGARDLVGVWAKERGKWRQLTKAEQTLKLKKFQQSTPYGISQSTPRSQSACRSIITNFFGLNSYQYAKIRDSFEGAGRDGWAGIYRAKKGYAGGPQFAIVVELPTYWQEVGVGTGLTAAVLAGAGLRHVFGPGRVSEQVNEIVVAGQATKDDSVVIHAPEPTNAHENASDEFDDMPPLEQEYVEPAKIQAISKEKQISPSVTNLLIDSNEKRERELNAWITFEAPLTETVLNQNTNEYYELRRSSDLDIAQLRKNMNEFLPLHGIHVEVTEGQSAQEMDNIRNTIHGQEWQRLTQKLGATQQHASSSAAEKKTFETNVQRARRTAKKN